MPRQYTIIMYMPTSGTLTNGFFLSFYVIGTGIDLNTYAYPRVYAYLNKQNFAVHIRWFFSLQSALFMSVAAFSEKTPIHARQTRKVYKLVLACRIDMRASRGPHYCITNTRYDRPMSRRRPFRYTERCPLKFLGGRQLLPVAAY